MNRVFVSFLFFYLAQCAFSQNYSFGDTALWNGPLSPDQVVKNRIKTMTVNLSGTRRPACSGPQPYSYTTIYEYDKQGYATKISGSPANEYNTHIRENEYKNNLLVKSVIRNKVLGYEGYYEFTLTKHYNNHLLCDTFTSQLGSIKHFRQTYLFDSLLRLVQTDTYEAIDSSFMLTKRQKLTYDNKSRLQKTYIIHPPTKPDTTSIIIRREIFYSKFNRSFKTVEYYNNYKRVSATKTTYRGNKLKSIRLKGPVKFKRPKYRNRKFRELEKFSEKKGIITRNNYRTYRRRRSLPTKFLRSKHLFDAATGLPLKEIVYPAKSASFPEGMQRETITVYTYERY
ncbi:MAG: hypothetical protein IT236_02045 [Bacteroidia bacterium]|nr:hypothetical protein [Bacteroidia bacterium]